MIKVNADTWLNDKYKAWCRLESPLNHSLDEKPLWEKICHKGVEGMKGPKWLDSKYCAIRLMLLCRLGWCYSNAIRLLFSEDIVLFRLMLY